MPEYNWKGLYDTFPASFKNNASNTSIPYGDDDLVSLYYSDWNISNMDLLHNHLAYLTFTNNVSNYLKSFNTSNQFDFGNGINYDTYSKRSDANPYMSYLLKMHNVTKNSNNTIGGRKFSGLFKTDALGNITGWNDKYNTSEDRVKAWEEYRKGPFGFYHLTPRVSSETETPTGGTPPSETPPTKTNETIPPYRFYTPGPNGPGASSGRKEIWTGWIPLTLQRMNDKASIARLRDLEMLKKFLLKTPLHINYRLTDDTFATNKMFELQKADILNQADLFKSADINDNLRVRQQALDNIGKIFNQLLAAKSLNYAQSIERATAVANANNKEYNDVGNFNRLQNINAWNNILLARQKADAANLQSANSYIGNMYRDLGETIKTDKVNNDARLRSSYMRQALGEQRKLNDSYSKYLADPSNWIEGMLDAFNNGYTKTAAWRGAHSEGVVPESFATLSEDDKAKFLDWFKTSEEAQSYRDKWDKHSQTIKEEWLRKYTDLSDLLDANLAGINVYETNNWRIGPNPNAKKPSSIYSTSYKSGGKVDKFSNYVALHIKEQENVRKHATASDKLSLAYLDKLLDRLNKEQLLILKSMFK